MGSFHSLSGRVVLLGGGHSLNPAALAPGTPAPSPGAEKTVGRGRGGEGMKTQLTIWGAQRLSNRGDPARPCLSSSGASPSGVVIPQLGRHGSLGTHLQTPVLAHLEFIP